MRVGFVGAGLIATYHSKMLRRAGVEIERAGVFDPDTARMNAFAAASGHRPCGSEDEVLDSCDAVYICTWTSQHPRLVAAAATRGLHIFCEKPLATNLRDAEQMAVAVQTAGVINQVGLVLRHSPAYLVARRLIDSPGAGRVMSVVFRDDQFIPVQGHYGSTWRADRTKAGAGTLLEHSIHDVDMLTYLTGEPIERVSANLANFHAIDGIEDVISSTIRFESGATGTLASVWHDNLARPSLRRVEVFCEQRHLIIEGNDWSGPISWTDADGATGTLGGDDLIGEGERIGTTGLNPDREFILAIEQRRPAYPDFSVAVAAHRTVDAMYRSAAADSMPFVVRRPSPHLVTSDRLTIGGRDEVDDGVEVAEAPDWLAAALDIVQIPTRATYALRARVLRRGTPSSDPRYGQDDDLETFHLGALVDGRIVATSTWAIEAWPGEPGLTAMRLRGMAVEDGTQGTGVGAALVDAGLARAELRDLDLVWASARDAVLGFYLRQGFVAVGDGYVDAATGLPHHDIVRRL